MFDQLKASLFSNHDIFMTTIIENLNANMYIYEDIVERRKTNGYREDNKKNIYHTFFFIDIFQVTK